jgi:hypothetical protein
VAAESSERGSAVNELRELASMFRGSEFTLAAMMCPLWEMEPQILRLRGCAASLRMTLFRKRDVLAVDASQRKLPLANGTGEYVFGR